MCELQINKLTVAPFPAIQYEFKGIFNKPYVCKICGKLEYLHFPYITINF